MEQEELPDQQALLVLSEQLEKLGSLVYKEHKEFLDREDLLDPQESLVFQDSLVLQAGLAILVQQGV